MIPEIREASYEGEYVIRMVFNDGASGCVNLVDELHGEVFEPLKDVSYFRQFKIHPDFKTLVWPNGADFAPEYLHDLVLGVSAAA